MSFAPYRGDSYLTLSEIEAFLGALEAAFPDRFECRSIGKSREGRDIWMVVVGNRHGGRDDRPAFWLDAGTHCSEWTGIMAAVYTLSRWAEEAPAWLDEQTAYVVPVISPDGFEAMRNGAPFIRSTLRPPRDGRPRVGLDPCDMTGDGRVLWMRWKSPAGSWIFDADNPIRMRHRTIDDAPEDAWVVCSEGRMLNWDGVAWTRARLVHGVDLNRNFPSHWAPFEMFGMDSGDFPMSEPESRAVVDAFRAGRRIGAAVTNHTYTGCILTQPYRDPSPLSDGDIDLMERMAESAVEGTGYTVKRVVPDFTYDPKKPIVGVWADAMTGTFGVPGYTLELWNPYGYAGIEVEDPAKFFKRPDIGKIGTMLDRFAEDPENIVPWAPFEHPDLGSVEVGGLDYMKTVRNPPVAELPAECERGFQVADRVRRMLPRVESTVSVRRAGEVAVIELVLENQGYLSTSSLQRAREIGMAPPVTARLETDGTLVEGVSEVELGWLDGWGALQASAASQPVYPGLPMAGGVRQVVRWVVRGGSEARVVWDAGRGGRGATAAPLGG